MSEETPAKVGDFHIHTNAYPWEKVRHSPAEAVRWAKKELELDAIAITDHDTTKGLDEALNAGEKYGIIVVPGIEIRSFAGTHFADIIALGITLDEIERSRQGIPTRRDPATVAKWIRDHGGIAIAAHPREKPGTTAISYSEIERLQDLLDGIEVVTLRGRSESAVALAKRLNMAQIGSSDTHIIGQMGLVRTKLLGNPETYDDVIDIIKARRVEAFKFAEVPEYLKRTKTNMLFYQFLGRKPQ